MAPQAPKYVSPLLSWGVQFLLLGLGVLLLWSGRAEAQLQTFRLDRFDPAPALNDGLALSLPSTLGHLRPSAQLVLDYGRRPLVTKGYMADTKEVAIISDRLNAHVALALGLSERAEVFARLPVVLFQQGDAPTPGGRRFNEPSAAGLSDLTLGGSYHLSGDEKRGPSLALNAALSLPTGSRKAFGSDGSVGGRGTLSFAQAFEHATLALESGMAYRPERQYGSRAIGTEFLYRAGLHVPVGARTRLMLEANGASSILDNQFFKKDARPLETLLGARAHLGGGIHGTLGVGVGLLAAPGVATPRALLGIGYMPTADEKRRSATPEPVTEAEPETPVDADRDGVLGSADQCPSDAEDLDGFEDSDGCPDEDDDRDGVPDAQDRCKAESEDMDGDRDDDGCPEEALPLTPAPAASPAPMAAQQTADGEAPEPIHFGTNTAGLTAETREELWAAMRWLARHPGTYKLTIEGHASSEGTEERNQQLSRDRALSVARWLDKREPWLKTRKVYLTVDTVGKSSSEPIASNETEEGRQQNRRVELELSK